MTIEEWIACWEALVPLGLQEEWDHSGFQLGRQDREIRGIVYSLDLTEGAIQLARDEDCNLIFTHHPLFFKGPKAITDQSQTGRLALTCAEQGIAVYASHTAFDSVNGGVNDCLADLLDLRGRKALLPISNQDPLHIYSSGMGRIGQVPKTRLADLAHKLGQRMGLESVIYYGEDDRPIERVALVSGSGMDFIDEAVRQGAQLYVTGDIKYHQALEALGQGIALLDLGHYESEFPALATAKRWSTTILPEVKHRIAPNPAGLLRKYAR